MIDWDGPSRQPCPECGRGPKEKTCGVGIDPSDGKLKAHCFRCEHVETFKVDDWRAKARSGPVVALARPTPAKDVDHARKQGLAAELWAKSRPITPTTPGGQYLADTRLCPLPPEGSDLHELSDLALFGFRGPALVGRMTLALDYRVMTGLHVTWLRQVNGKWQRHERRYLGPKKGAVVRLWPDECVSTGLGVTEGIETGLTLGHVFQPVWAALDAGNLAALPVLSGIESLLIGADHDDAGKDAARTCAALWAALGREVRIAMPPTPKTDLNDLLRAA